MSQSKQIDDLRFQNETEKRLFYIFREKIDKILERNIIEQNYNDHKGVVAASSDWDRYLNKLDITRIEFHLPEREVEKNHIRIEDPFACLCRFLEIPNYIAFKVLILGLP